MKLLLDANLSWSLVKKLQTKYPETIHINQTGLQSPADDIAIWEFAKRLNFIILTFDENYLNLSVRFEHPPKVIFLTSLNQTSEKVIQILDSYHNKIEEFFSSETHTVLQIIST